MSIGSPHARWTIQLTVRALSAFDFHQCAPVPVLLARQPCRQVCRHAQDSTHLRSREAGWSDAQHMIRYYMVWYDMIWYGMVWYGMVWYGSYLSVDLCVCRRCLSVCTACTMHTVRPISQRPLCFPVCFPHQRLPHHRVGHQRNALDERQPGACHPVDAHHTDAHHTDYHTTPHRTAPHGTADQHHLSNATVELTPQLPATCSHDGATSALLCSASGRYLPACHHL